MKSLDTRLESLGRSILCRGQRHPCTGPPFGSAGSSEAVGTHPLSRSPDKLSQMENLLVSSSFSHPQIGTCSEGESEALCPLFTGTLPPFHSWLEEPPDRTVQLAHSFSHIYTCHSLGLLVTSEHQGTTTRANQKTSRDSWPSQSGRNRRKNRLC